jgi:hypothetical protein
MKVRPSFILKPKIMKKSLVALAVVTLSLMSCKKDYVCECSKIRTTSSGNTTTYDDKYTFKDNRARAESRCDAQETAGSDLLGDYTRECQIK